MVDPLSLIYSQLWWLQISEFMGNLNFFVQIREFATALAQNISNLEGQPWELEFPKSAIFSKIRKFDKSQINLVEPIFLIVQEMKISCYSLK